MEFQQTSGSLSVTLISPKCLWDAKKVNGWSGRAYSSIREAGRRWCEGVEVLWW